MSISDSFLCFEFGAPAPCLTRGGGVVGRIDEIKYDQTVVEQTLTGHFIQ